MTIDLARNGLPSAEHGGVRIHSPYDPRREARRFLDTALADGDAPRAVVIIGAGLGYVDEAAAERWPNANILAIHLSRELHEGRISSGGDDAAPRVRRWHPECGVDLASFLSEALTESAMRGLRVLVWPPAAAAMPVEAEEANRSLAEIVRRNTGSISATAAFGRSWIRNAVRNFVDLDRIALPAAVERPVVLAASGPSLEFALPLLSSNRHRFRLWALPSAMPALKAASLAPDLIFATDSGFWARLHMRSFPRDVPIAMPLSAAPLPPHTGTPLLIRQGIPGESRLLRSPEWPLLPVPARGTVAATAVEAWAVSARGPLLLVGLDLCWRDLRSHARPHAFDGWIASRTDRRNPPLNESWNRAVVQAPIRSGALRTGPALETYADWFRGLDGKDRIVRFRSPDDPDDPAPIPGIPMRGPEVFREWAPPGESGGYRTIKAPLDRRRRHAAVVRLLNDWKERLDGRQAGEGDDDFDELLYVLDPGGALNLAGAPEEARKAIADDHRARVRRTVEELRAAYA